VRFQDEVLIVGRRKVSLRGSNGKDPPMARGTSFAAWRQAYERAFAGAERLPLVLRLTPAVLLYVVYKLIRYTPDEVRKAQRSERV